MADKFRLEPDLVGDQQKVIVTGEIDMEDEALQTSPIINIYIQAEEEKGGAKSLTNCMLQIQDINDNKPTFNSQIYSAEVKENVNIGQILPFTSEGGLSPRVEDVDLTFNKMTISFQNETMSDYFLVNPSSVVSSGEVTLSSKVPNNPLLDADTGTSTVDIVVVARDSDKPDEYFDMATFTIIIKDVNDMVPYFTQSNYNVSVKEDLSDLDESKVLIQVSALDKDYSADYGTPSLRYTFVPGSELQGLSLNVITGVITVDQPDTFNYEVQTVHSLEIEARDCGGADVCDPQARYTRTTLTIQVENVNDNPPELESPDTCRVEFYNNRRENKILDLEASDGDLMDTVLFSMESENSPFSVNNTGKSKAAILVNISGIVEVEDTFDITILLRDNGTPPLSTNVSCSLVIKDVNDKNPVFLLPEPDRKYWIKDDLLPEQAMTFYNGDPLRLEAKDDDANTCYNTVNYFFRSNIEPTYREFFSLDPNTGVVTLLKNITGKLWETDNGIPNLITLPLEAKDDSGPGCQGIPNEVVGELSLKVFTDYEPRFEQEVQNVEFNETVTEDTLITLLPSQDLQSARDDNNESPPPDPAWVNQTVCYYILQPPQSPFDLDKETNTLRVVQPLDVDNCAECKQYDLTIGASNNCNQKPNEDQFLASSKMRAIVDVRDLNDNYPVFKDIRSYYVYSTVEGECKDCDISADDDDICKDLLQCLNT